MFYPAGEFSVLYLYCLCFNPWPIWKIYLHSSSSNFQNLVTSWTSGLIKKLGVVGGSLKRQAQPSDQTWDFRMPGKYTNRNTTVASRCHPTHLPLRPPRPRPVWGVCIAAGSYLCHVGVVVGSLEMQAPPRDWKWDLLAGWTCWPLHHCCLSVTIHIKTPNFTGNSLEHHLKMEEIIC